MDKFYEFIEEAIKKAEKAGKTKRAFKTKEASALARASMAEQERAEVGATRRAKIKETGLGERLGREQEFARPFQEAEVGRSRARGELREAEAEKVRYGTEFEKGTRGTIEDILKAEAAEARISAKSARLGFVEEEREIKRRDKVEAEAAMKIEPKSKPEPAVPGRRLRPSIKRALLTARGPFGSIEELYDVSKWLKKGLGESYEYAFPRGR